MQTAELVGTPIDVVIEQFRDAESNYAYHRFNKVALENDRMVFSQGTDSVYEADVLSPQWLAYFCNVANVPLEYLKTLDRNMLLELIRYHHDKMTAYNYSNDGKLIIGENKANDSFGIVSALRRYVSGSELLTMYRKFFEGQTNVAHYAVDVENPRFSILNDQWNTALLGNFDVQYFGLTMEWKQNSSVPRIFGSSHRPHCANLMHVPQNIGRINTKFKNLSSTIVNERFREGGRKAVQYVNNVLIPNLTATTTKTFKDLVGYLNTLPISQNTRELIIKAFLNEEGNTVYHIIQACTFATTHFGLEDDEINALNKLVAYLLDESTDHTCNKCHQSVLTS